MTPQTDFNNTMMSLYSGIGGLDYGFPNMVTERSSPQKYADRASDYLTVSSITTNHDATDVPGDQPALVQ